MFSRRFTLRHTFEKMSELDSVDGPEETHFGVPWNISIVKDRKSGENDELCLGVYLDCCKFGDTKNPWSVSVDGTFRIDNGNEKDKREKTFQTKYHDYQYFLRKVCDWDTLMEKYVKNDKLTVEIEVIITKMEGLVPKRKLNFDAPEENITDVVLIVGDQKFNVLKGMLARFSDFFKPLFFSGYKESQQTEIKLEEVDPDVFHMVLEIIHGKLECIKKDTVENILHLARQYQVEVATDRCIDFLINCLDIDKNLRYRLASEYKLISLQNHLLKKIKTLDDADKVLKHNIQHLSDEFVIKIMRKVYSK